MTLHLTPIRMVLTLLLGLALFGLAACDSGTAPSSTPVTAATPAGATTPATSDQAPAPVSTQGAAPDAVATGGAAPIAVPTGATDAGPVSSAPTQAPDPNEPPRISIDETRKLMDSNSVLLIDVRGKSLYDQRHIAGAVSVPFEEIDKRVSELPKDKLIIAYCQ